ncbi:MAG: CheR family methyltransferase [bacterium]
MKADNPDRTARLPVDMAIRPLTNQEFTLFQTLIHRKAGIYLSPAKKTLLEGRLNKRLRELGLNSFGDYYRLVIEERDGAELVHLLDRISTNETHFFREPRQFSFVEQRVFPEWTSQAASGMRSRRIRVWSAGCSTGEEPYSIAMTLWERFPPSAGWEIEILATDLSTRALDVARTAVWPITKAKEIPPGYLKRFMLKGTRTQEGKMKAGPEIRSIVRFERLNLNDEAYPVTGLFDLIFCRNVLIYFDAQSRVRVIHRLLNHLAPSGYLFVGHAESLNAVTDRVQPVMPTVYIYAGEKQWEVKTSAAPLPGGEVVR